MIKLTPNPNNPRQVTKEKVDRLIKKIKSFPEMLEKRPIVYDENKIIPGGNTKYKALKILEKEGFEVKDSYFSDASGWTEDQKKNFIINDNLHEGDWDYEILANKWDMDQLTDWGVNLGAWQTQEDIDPNAEWSGMPEMDPKDDKPYRTLFVHFTTQDHVDQFAKLMGQSITEKTKWIWFPYRKDEIIKNTKIIADNES
jgi:hypothetical protein